MYFWKKLADLDSVVAASRKLKITLVKYEKSIGALKASDIL